MIIPSTFPKVLRDPSALEKPDLTVQSPEQEADARAEGYTEEIGDGKQTPPPLPPGVEEAPKVEPPVVNATTLPSEFAARHGRPQEGGGTGPFPNGSTSTPAAFRQPPVEPPPNAPIAPAAPRKPRPVAYASSSTPVEIGIGRATFILADGRANFVVGGRVRATSADNSADFMEGVVTKYKSTSGGAAPNGTTLIVNVDAVGGSGEHAGWDINSVEEKK